MAPGLALPRLVAVCSVVVADVAVVFVRARGLPAAAPWVGQLAALATPVVARGLPAAAAGNYVDGFFVVRVDGGDGVAPPPVQCTACPRTPRALQSSHTVPFLYRILAT
jgi:hypothetical protein